MTCQQRSLNKHICACSRLAGYSFFAVAGWLFVMLAAATPAIAKDATFVPKLLIPAPWTIAPIASNDAEGRMFCSAKTSFDTTLSFVFARDSKGAQSLAFEFPNKSFTAGATLQILLAIGEVQYPLNALAATDRILLIGIARHSELEQRLMQNTQVYLQVNNRQYIMSLSGLAASAAQVDACIAATAAGETFETAKVRPDRNVEKFSTITPAVKREITRMRNVSDQEIESFNPANAAQNAVLMDEIRRLKRENQKLLAEKQAAESQLLASTLDTAAGDAPSPQAAAQVSVMPAMAPYIMRQDKELLWPPSKSFADMVATYMTTEASRCPADFAQTPGKQYKIAGDMPVQEMEIACLGMAKSGEQELPGDYAGALLFVGRAGKIDVIINQGPAGMIEQALQARQSIARTFEIQQ